MELGEVPVGELGVDCLRQPTQAPRHALLGPRTADGRLVFLTEKKGNKTHVVIYVLMENWGWD